MTVMHKVRDFFGLADNDEVAEHYYDEPAEYSREVTSREYDHLPPAAAPVGQSSSRYSSHARTLEPSTVVFHLKEFSKAKNIAEAYCRDDIVIFTMTEVDKSTAQRVVDFCAGLAYAQRGNLICLSQREYALIPKGITRDKEELRQALA